MGAKKAVKTAAAREKKGAKGTTGATPAKPDFKAAAAGETSAPELASNPAQAETSQPQVETTAGQAKPEKLAPKLRRKGDIMKALRAGAHVLHTESGLYRIIQGTDVHPASKRRIVALIDAGILKQEQGQDGRYFFDAAAETVATERAKLSADPKSDKG